VGEVLDAVELVHGSAGPQAARLVAGPVGATAAVAAGVGIARQLPPGPGHLLLASAAIAGVAACLGTGVARRGLVGIVLVALGGAAQVRAAHGLVVSPLADATARHASVMLVATVIGDPDPAFGTVQVVVRATRWSGLAGAPDVPAEVPTSWSTGGGRHLLARAADRSGRLAVLAVGDEVVLVGRLGPLAGAAQRWADRHVVGVLTVHAVIGLAPSHDPLVLVADRTRDAILAGGVALEPTVRGLVAGFLVGDDRGLPDTVRDEFRASGLSHLLVVSGANLAFVLALVRPALRRLSSRGRLVGSLATVVLFGSITRWEPSVVRAAAMASIALVAAAAGRPQPGMRVLALAVSASLLLDPFLLVSIGFLLSVGASTGILLLARPIASRLRGPRVVVEPLAVTAAAQIGVLPVSLPVFGSVPLVALPANLLAAPAAGPLTICGLVTGAAAGVLHRWSPGAATLVQSPTRLLARWVLLVAHVAAREPVPLDARDVCGIVAVGAGAAAARRAARGRPSGSR
jgi:competence protein ComEC